MAAPVCSAEVDHLEENPLWSGQVLKLGVLDALSELR